MEVDARICGELIPNSNVVTEQQSNAKMPSQPASRCTCTRLDRLRSVEPVEKNGGETGRRARARHVCTKQHNFSASSDEISPAQPPASRSFEKQRERLEDNNKYDCALLRPHHPLLIRSHLRINSIVRIKRSEFCFALRSVRPGGNLSHHSDGHSRQLSFIGFSSVPPNSSS